MAEVPKFRSLTDVLGALERGQLNAASRGEIEKIVKGLVERGKGTATLTVTLSFSANDGMVDVIGKMVSKLPQEARKRTILWASDDGALQLQDPRQQEMFTDVNKREDTRAV